MRKVKGTGDKVNMNANSMLVGKEVDGNRITALYTLNRNGVRRRITKSEFYQSAQNNRIINCKFNGRSLVGIEDSLRNIPTYDKKTGRLKNNITEEQVILSVNQKLIQNKLTITAKLKYNNQIIGYIVANEQGQEKRFSRDNTYKLVRQGFLPEYKAKIDNGVAYVYGGNINSLPEIKVDSQGRNIEDKERMKKVIEEQKKLHEQHEKELKKQKELEKEQHRKEIISAEKIAKDLKKQLKKEDKEEKIKQEEQEKKVNERNKKLEKIDKILSELGNTSEILRRQVVDVYVDKNITEITKECIENTGEKIIKANDKYIYALEVLKIISKTNGAIKQEDSDKISIELKKIATNLLDTTDNEQIIEIVSNKVANIMSKVDLHLVVKEIHSIWEDGTISDLKTVGAIVKLKDKNVYIKYHELSEDLKNEANRVGTDKIVISNKVPYTNNQIENYIKIVTEQSGNSIEGLNKEVIKKVKEFILDRESNYVALTSLNGFINKLMDEVSKVVGDELDTVKAILALTLIHPNEIKAAIENMQNFNKKLVWNDRYSLSDNIKIKLADKAFDSNNKLNGMKVTQLSSCTVLNINGKLCLLPKYINIKELAAGIIVNYQVTEQKPCYISVRYNSDISTHTEEWISYGNLTHQLRNCISKANNLGDITEILQSANVNIGIINDIKEIKKLLKASLNDISMKNIEKESITPIKVYTKFLSGRLEIVGAEVKIKNNTLVIGVEQFTTDIIEWATRQLNYNKNTSEYGENIAVHKNSLMYYANINEYLLAYSEFDVATEIIGDKKLTGEVRDFISSHGESKGREVYTDLDKVSKFCKELAYKSIRKHEKERLKQEQLEQEQLENKAKQYNKRAKEMAKFYLTKELLELTVVDMEGLSYITNEMESFESPDWSDKFITSLGNFTYRVVEDSHTQRGSYFDGELKFHRFEHTIGIQVCKHNMYIVPEDISIRDFGALLLCAYEKETESSGYLEMRYEGRLSGHTSDNYYLMEETDKLRQNIYRCESMEEIEDCLKGADIDLNILEDIGSIHNVMSEYLGYYFDIDKYHLSEYNYKETLTNTSTSEYDIKAGLDMYDDI